MRFTHCCASVLALVACLGAQSLAAEPAGDLREETRAALRNSLRLDKDNREAIINRLVALYSELQNTDQLKDEDRRRLQAQVRGRLERLAAIVQRQLVIGAGGQSTDESPPSSVSRTNAKQAPVANQPAEKQVLAQRLPVPQRPIPPRGFRQGLGFGGRAGPGFAANGGPAVAQPPDNGQALVDLIQRTIEPSSWDVNGGPGSIVYFRQPRVLVVRQRSEVHEQLLDVVRGLRQ